MTSIFGRIIQVGDGRCHLMNVMDAWVKCILGHKRRRKCNDTTVFLDMAMSPHLSVKVYEQKS
jgi:hypothetical protein